MVDINRGTTGVNLPPAASAEIWSKTAEESAVMRLSRQVDLPGSGVTIDVITGDAQADWVNETAEKPVSRPTLAAKTMSGYMLAVIVPFSNQFRRDKAALYNALVDRLPSALGRKFDSTVFGGSAPGSNFDVLSGASAQGIAGKTYAGLVNADLAVATGGGDLNGWALAPAARALLLSGVDADGRPLFINNIGTDGQVPALLGQPVSRTKGVYKAGTPAQIGFAGDWTSAVYGTVEGVQVSISDQATLTDGEDTINLWQRNMFAVRAEIEVGFRVKDVAHFVRLTNTVVS